MAGTKDQTEVRFMVDASYLKQNHEKLGDHRATDVARSALTLLNWAAGEVKNGRLILSSSENGQDVHRLVMPDLTK